MPKMTVDGLHESSGEQGFPALDPGTYRVEINNVNPEEGENDKGSYVRWNFETTVIEGPDQDRDGSAPDGKKIFHNIFILNPDHQSYEKAFTLGLNQLKAMANAAGVKVSSSGGINSDDFIGKEVLFKLSKREYDGEEVNDVRKVKPVE